jgi:hypothetical protein
MNMPVPLGIRNVDTWRRVCLKTFENLTTDTALTVGQIDAVLLAGALEFVAVDSSTKAGGVVLDRLLARVSRDTGVDVGDVDSILTWCAADAAPLIEPVVPLPPQEWLRELTGPGSKGAAGYGWQAGWVAGFAAALTAATPAPVPSTGGTTETVGRYGTLSDVSGREVLVAHGPGVVSVMLIGDTAPDRVGSLPRVFESDGARDLAGLILGQADAADTDLAAVQTAGGPDR